MTYQPDTEALRGTTVISATATEALAVTLHLSPELTARSVTVDGAPVASFAQQGDRDLVLGLDAPLEGGDDFEVVVAYDGTPGAGWLSTASGGATAFMGNSSAWYPVHEDAHDRAAFHLTATVPEEWSVVSVGREGPGSGASEEPGWSTFRWSEPDIDPAHLAVSVDQLTLERSTLADGTPVVNACAPGLRESTGPLAERLPEILDFLSGRFGPYPFQAAGNVFLHVNDDGPATAPQTRPVYLGAGNARFMTLEAVVHEQAHQWYGISAAPRRAEDTCLSECFASYATWLWDEDRNGVDLDARYREQVTAARDDPSCWAELYRPARRRG